MKAMNIVGLVFAGFVFLLAALNYNSDYETLQGMDAWTILFSMYAIAWGIVGIVKARKK